MILNETVAAIADAIREKTGKSELIKPIDFASEIKSISAGGGESASAIEYLDVSADTQIAIPLRQCALFAKMMKGGKAVVGPVEFMRTMLTADGNQGAVTTLAVAVDFASIVKVRMGEEYLDTSLVQFLEMIGVTKELLDSFPRITKEQFYDLNA